MTGNQVPASYKALFRLLQTTGGALTESLERLFKDSGEPFDPATARFEADVYTAFRMSCCLQRNLRAWEDLATLFMIGVVGTHRSHVRSDNLDGVFEERVETYGRCWNACVDSKTYPALQCLQMLRIFILGAARRGRIDPRVPLDITDGFMGEVFATPTLIELDSNVVGKLDCALKNIMRFSDDLASLTENEVLMAAARGFDEASQILGHSGKQPVQSQLRDAMRAMGRDANPQTGLRRKRWWQFWA